MVNYIIIDEKIIGVILTVLIGIFIICFASSLIDSIKLINKIRRRKIRIEKSQPYKLKYEKLQEEGKYQEAIDYGRKYDKYLRVAYYYW